MSVKFFEKLSMVLWGFILSSSLGVLSFVMLSVQAAKRNGIDVRVAANQNAPIFIMFSKILLIFAIAALIIGIISKDFKTNIKKTIASCVAILAIFIFSLYITPKMETLRPLLTSSLAAKNSFDSLHKVSQIDFGVIILASLATFLFALKPYKRKSNETL